MARRRGEEEEEEDVRNDQIVVAPPAQLLSTPPQRAVKDRYRKTFTSSTSSPTATTTDNKGDYLSPPAYDEKRNRRRRSHLSEDTQLEDFNFSFAGSEREDSYMADMMPPMPRPEEMGGSTSKRQRDVSSIGSIDGSQRKRARRSPSPPGDVSYIDIDDIEDGADDDYLRDFGVGIEENSHGNNTSTRSRHSIFGSGRRLKTIKPRKSRFIEGSMNNRHSEKPPSIIIGNQTEYDQVSPGLKSNFPEARARTKTGGNTEEFSVAGLASAVFTFRAVSYFKDTYWNPRKQKFEEMVAKEEQKRRAEEAYQELKKKGMPGTVPPLPPRLQNPPGEYARKQQAIRRNREAAAEMMDLDRLSASLSGSGGVRSRQASSGPSVSASARMEVSEDDDLEEEDDEEVGVGRAVTTDRLVPAESYSPKKRHSRRISDGTAATLIEDYDSSKSPSREAPDYHTSFQQSPPYPYRSPPPPTITPTTTRQSHPISPQHPTSPQSYHHQQPLSPQSQPHRTTTTQSAPAPSKPPSTVKTLRARASALFTPRGSAAQKLEEARRERLLKKYSNLEDKLLKARQELAEAGVAPPPLPPSLSNPGTPQPSHGGGVRREARREEVVGSPEGSMRSSRSVRSAVSGVFGPLTSPSSERRGKGSASSKGSKGQYRPESFVEVGSSPERERVRERVREDMPPPPPPPPAQVSSLAMDASRKGKEPVKRVSAESGRGRLSGGSIRLVRD